MADNPFGAPTSQASSTLDHVFHFFVDKDGEETGEKEEIRLAPDGSADLSTMKDQGQARTWAEMGIKDELGANRVYPNEGRRFLKMLLKKNNQLWRFRRNA